MSGGITFPDTLLSVCVFGSSVLNMQEISEKELWIHTFLSEISSFSWAMASKSTPTYIDYLTIETNIILVGTNLSDYVVGFPTPFLL